MEILLCSALFSSLLTLILIVANITQSYKRAATKLFFFGGGLFEDYERIEVL